MDEQRALTGTDALAVSAMTDGVGRGYPNVVYTGGNGGLFGNNDNGALLLLAILLMGGGNWGNNNGVTDGALAASQAAQTTQMQISQVLSDQQNALFQIANLFSTQNIQMMEQNNNNTLQMLNGFNAINSNITNQTNQLGTLMLQLSSKMDTCCCEIKTQALQNRLDDALADKVRYQNAIDNANQSQYILSQLGRFVAYVGSGTPTVTAS